MSGFILDFKNTIAQVSAPIGNELVINDNTHVHGILSVNNYNFPYTNAPGPGYTFEDVKGDGNIDWVIPTGNGNLRYNFKRITDNGINYILDVTDNAIEIVSNTYITVTLPAAAGLGGQIYLISRGSDINIALYAQSGDTIDAGNPYIFHKKYTRIVLMSNDVNTWYTV